MAKQSKVVIGARVSKKLKKKVDSEAKKQKTTTSILIEKILSEQFLIESND